MDFRKRLIFLFLVLFPFGQLLRISLVGISLHSIDIVVGLIAIVTLFAGGKRPAISKKISNLILILLVSQMFSLLFFNLLEIVVGLLYIVRLVAYIYLFVASWQEFNREGEEGLVLNGLLAVGVVAGIFGWIQYFWYPDTRFLYEFGWDDHLYRLIGSFLDPAFMGILMVLTGLLALVKRKYFLFLFLVITLAFTYSRASYLAFMVGVVVWGIYERKAKQVAVVALSFLILVLLLPRPGGYGVKLERTHSIVAKVTNYQESLELIGKSPVFGLGFNNVCVIKVKFLDFEDTSNHACSGLDNSLALIMVTTGIVGLIVFADLGWSLVGRMNLLFTISLIAVLVHGMFTNTLFYPWVMGWMALLGGVVYRE